MTAQNLLTTRSSIKGTQVVQEILGIQAQEDRAAYLSIHSRSIGLDESSVKNELLSERTIIRSWFMRGTLHLVARQDLDWLLPLLAPIFISKNRRRYVELGLDENSIQKGVKIIQEALAAQGSMTRHELAPYLLRQGVSITGQALIYLINRAAWEGVLCLGPEIDGKQAYVLLADWIGRDLDNQLEGDYVRLVERFLNAYGPAGLKDFSAWSGLPISIAQAAWKQLEHKLIEMEYPSGSGYILPEQAEMFEEPAPESLGVCLLPKFDTYLLGYDDRDLMLPSEYTKRVNAGGGILRPVLLVNGCVQGIWKIIRTRNGILIQVEAFTELSPMDIQLLDMQVMSIEQFLEVHAELQFHRYQ
jgi:hypothetical protein